jgi:hypothetical protein
VPYMNVGEYWTNFRAARASITDSIVTEAWYAMTRLVRAVPGECICNWHNAALDTASAFMVDSSHFGKLTSSRKSISQTRWAGFAHPR